MSVLGFVIIWYFLGITGCVLGEKMDMVALGKNFTVKDLIGDMFLALLGPIVLLIAICYFFNNTNLGSRVLIKGKQK